MRRLLLLIVLLLLPSQALAECAWVLWTKGAIPIGKGDRVHEIDWEPLLGYTKLDECQQKATKRLTKLLEEKGTKLAWEGTVVTKGVSYIPFAASLTP